jgi:serine/threonine-protein kinase
MKPANCFVVQRDGEPDFIKLVDFGISKVRAEGGMELTQATSALGTPLYMSLEQAKSPKDVDARTDLYSTAVILYEMLAGTPPFVPDSDSLMELFSMLMNEDPKLLSEIRGDLPPGLDTVVRKGLAKDRADRFQTAEEMAEALAPFADQRSDHVVSRLLRTVPGQHRSLRPPPIGVATTSDMPKSVTGTMLMSNAPPGSALPRTEKQGPRWSDSGGGTAATTGGAVPRTILEERRGTPLVFAIAIVAVAAVAAATYGLGKLSSGQQGGSSTAQTGADPPPSGSPLQPTTTVTPTPPSATAETSGEPTAKVSASANVGKVPPPRPSSKQTLEDIKRAQ